MIRSTLLYRRSARWLALVALALGLSAPALPTGFAQTQEPSTAAPNRAASAFPRFLLAMNYEGPADRAWQMWEDGRFDPALIDADFGRAEGAGLHALRVFVQAALARDVAADRWEKLDIVVGLAEKHSLHLIVTLHDYADADVARVAAVGGRVAARYRDRPGVLALDLRNEPRFNDLALARYPAPVPLQTQDLVAHYGERLSRADLPAYRESDEGRRSVPSSLAEEPAWLYANNLLLYRQLLADASTWIQARGSRGTTLDYLADPASAHWQPFVEGLNATLAAWLAPQIAAIREADAARAITVGHVDAVLASLPANAALDYETLHRYSAPTAAGVRGTLALVETLRSLRPHRPYVLGEFGYASNSVTLDQAAVLEIATYLGVWAQGGAGAAKWMLLDMPPGENPRERSLGAFTVEGASKPIVPALAALRWYLDTSQAPPGTLRLEDDAAAGPRYVYRPTDALFLGGKSVDGGDARLAADVPTQLFLSSLDPSVLKVWASGPSRIELNLERLLAGASAGATLTLHTSAGDRPVPLEVRSDGWVAATLPSVGEYSLTVQRVAAEPWPPLDPAPDNQPPAW